MLFQREPLPALFATEIEGLVVQKKGLGLAFGQIDATHRVLDQFVMDMAVL
jgi:hypothetical protein